MNDLKYIDLKNFLHEKQKYVIDISDELGIDVKAVRHNKFTNSCFEKADLLDWPANRIVKSVFLNNENYMYGFIFPELGKDHISPQHINYKNISKVLEISKGEAKRLSNSHCPEGMEFGTCSPFVFNNSFDEGSNERILSKLFFHEIPDLEKEIVDISIGGIGEEAHKTSVHLPYESIYDILSYQFADKISKVVLFEKV